MLLCFLSAATTGGPMVKLGANVPEGGGREGREGGRAGHPQSGNKGLAMTSQEGGKR